MSAWDCNLHGRDCLVGAHTQELVSESRRGWNESRHKRRTSVAAKQRHVALKTLRGDQTDVTVNFSVQPRILPAPTRMAEAWTLTVHSLHNCPKHDLTSQSDPVVHIQTFVESQREIESTLASAAGSEKQTALHLRDCSRSTAVATNEPNPYYEETFEVGWIKPEARTPFLAALARAMPTLKQTMTSSRGFGNEKSLPDFIDQESSHQSLQGKPARRIHFSMLFPSRIGQGMGVEDLDRQRLFLQHCFPDLAARGKLIDPSRRKIKAKKEKMCCAVLAVLVCMCLVEFGVLLGWRMHAHFFFRNPCKYDPCNVRDDGFDLCNVSGINCTDANSTLRQRWIGKRITG